MEVRRRTDQKTSPSFDVRYIEDLLREQYTNVYIIFSTLENDPTEAWEQEGDHFLLINIPSTKVVDGTVDYKTKIIENLPMIEWMDYKKLIAYVEKKMPA